ncbi:MAG: hypothetical protein NZ108_08345, partial [Bacteroidia bacterium]|nr:hypothetical protein [Bacteroidia bacterium]
GRDLFLCLGDSPVTLEGSALTWGHSALYFWTPTTGLTSPYILEPQANPANTTEYVLTVLSNGCLSHPDTMKVTVSPKPYAGVVNQSLAFCSGAGGVQIQGFGSGGIGSLSYVWTPTTGLDSAFTATPVANPTITTTYSFFATDSMGCRSDTVLVTVRVDTVPIANAGPDQFICEGSGAGVFLQGSIVNSGFGSYQYFWSPAAGLSDTTIANPFATPDTTTIYTLVVRNNITGCESQRTTLDTLSTVVVFVSPKPVANAGPDTVQICFGDSTILGDVPSSAGPIYTYRWTPATGLSNDTIARPIAKPTHTTLYFLTVTSNGCESIADSVLVIVNPRPTADAGPVKEICPGDSVRLDGFGGGTSGPYTYRWVPALGLSDPTSPNPLASPTTTTTYTLYVAQNGCEGAPDSTLVQVLPVPTVDADVFNQPIGYRICSGDSITLPGSVTSNLSPIFWNWSPALGLDDSTKLNPVARPTESTVYYLTGTLGRCSVTDSVAVIIFPGVIATLSADTNQICNRTSTVLRAAGGIGSASFSWYPSTGLNRADTSEVIASPSTTTTYTVVVSEGG